MTSAPNRLPPLSGSKAILIVVLLAALLAGACSTSRTSGKTSGTTTKPSDKSNHEGEVRVYDPATGTYKWIPKDMVKVDTIQLKEDSTPPLVTDKDEVTDKTDSKKRAYHISLLLPFSATSHFDIASNDAKLDRFVQYYAGVQLAIEEVDPFKRNFLIHVYDAEGSTKTNDLITRDKNLAQADVIIGPYEKDGIQQMATYGLANEKFVISPWLPAFSVDQENPYFIQAVPGLQAHANAITHFLVKQWPQKKIYLVARDVPAEINRLSLFKKDPALNIEDLIIKDQTPDLLNTDLKKRFVAEGSVFILPYYAKADETFVNSFLRKLHAEKELEDITVIGLPQWIGFSNLNSNYMENLSVHLTLSTFLDVNHPDYKSFRNKFFERYHTDPDLQAFLGYDLMRWVAMTLQKGGKEGFISPAATWNDGLASGFLMQPVFKPGDAADVEMHTPLYYENVHIRIVQYDELDFHLVK